MTDAPEPLGTLEVALAHAARLLEKDPSLAAEQVGRFCARSRIIPRPA